MRIYCVRSNVILLYFTPKSKSTIWYLLDGLFTLGLFVNTSWFMSKEIAATHRCSNLNLARLCDQFVCLLPENEIKIKDYCLLDWKVRNWEHKKSTHVRRKSRFKRCSIPCASRKSTEKGGKKGLKRNHLLFCSILPLFSRIKCFMPTIYFTLLFRLGCWAAARKKKNKSCGKPDFIV